jgi:hypothetical protein
MIYKIPLNMRGKTININGFHVSESQWSSVVHCAHSLYENDGFDEDQQDDIEYRCSEIIETLRLQSEKTAIGHNESSQYDPQLDAFFEQFDESAIEMMVTYGECKNWNF